MKRTQKRSRFSLLKRLRHLSTLEEEFSSN